jgi:two-component system KDP operon response regulator KdpE
VAELPARILVVEDDPDLRELVQSILQEQGYSVVTAGTAADGIERAKAHQPVLVLLDFLLPGAKAPDFMSELRGGGLMPKTLLMTGAAPHPEGLALEVGADGCLAKPFDLDDLLASVAACLAGGAPGQPSPMEGPNPCI